MALAEPGIDDKGLRAVGAAPGTYSVMIGWHRPRTCPDRSATEEGVKTDLKSAIVRTALTMTTVWGECA